MAENKLDKSWKTFIEEENYVDTYQQGYLHGASDFQKRAIEQINKMLILSRNTNNPLFILGLRDARRIIKNLKSQ